MDLLNVMLAAGPLANAGGAIGAGLGAIGAGIVLGAKVPIILTSRADLPLAREASCALVKYFISHQKKEKNKTKKTPSGH